MNHSKRVKLIDKETGQEFIYNSPKEAANVVGFRYMTIIMWLNGLSSSKKYIAQYLDDDK